VSLVPPLDTNHLQIIADLTIRLTEMRQRKCEHLCIENVAPEIFGKLLYEFRTAGEHRIEQIVSMSPVNVDDLLKSHV
jgi:hypothetical protein